MAIYLQFFKRLYKRKREHGYSSFMMNSDFTKENENMDIQGLKNDFQKFPLELHMYN